MFKGMSERIRHLAAPYFRHNSNAKSFSSEPNRGLAFDLIKKTK